MKLRLCWAFLMSCVLLPACTDSGGKHEWSLLQVYEYQNRGAGSAENPIIKFHDDYCVAGFVSSRDGSQRVWVLMNPRFKPYLKKLPDQPVAISKAQYDSLPKKCRSDKRIESSLVRN